MRGDSRASIPALVAAAVSLLVISIDFATAHQPAAVMAAIQTTQVSGPHFVPADLPRYAGEESRYPYGDRQTGAQYEWRLFHARNAGEPELLYRTGRFVQGTAWSPDGQNISAWYETSGLPDPPIQPDQLLSEADIERILLEYLFLGGLITFNLSTPASPSRDELLTGLPILVPSPDDAHIAVRRDDGRRGSSVYVFDSSGRAKRLEAAGNSPNFYGWLPDSSGVLVQAPSQVTAGQGALYLVPLTGGLAVPIELGQDAKFGVRPAWSPDGLRLAYLVEGDLWLFDRTIGMSTRIASSLNPRFGDPRWSPNGLEIIVGGDLIALATGQTLVSLGAPYRAADAALSPDGRYFAVAEDPGSATTRVAAPCDPLGRNPFAGTQDNRVYLYDRLTGETRLVQDCGQGLTAQLQWLGDSRHLLIWQEPRQLPLFGAQGYAISLLDLQTGQKQPLTNGREIHAGALPSPDGGQVIVLGERLRIYSADGQLLREVVPPPGFDVPFAAWSPDGASFAYILGPAGFFPVYP